MRNSLVACALLSIVALAAGCGAGGGSSAVVPSGGGGSASAGSTAASVTIAIPAKPIGALSKSPAYVSPNTASIGIVVTPQAGSAYPVVTTNVPGSQCVASSGGYTCTISITATFGVDTIAIAAYSGANLGGSILSSGSITSTFSASASPSPALDVVLTGAVKQIGVALTHGDLTDAYLRIGQAATLTVTGKDASGATIIGTYDAPISVAVNGASDVTLDTTTFADSSHTTSTLSWTGAPTYYAAPTNGFTIEATAGGGSVTQNFTVSPVTTLLSLPVGDGGANTQYGTDLVASGSQLVFATQSSTSDGELESFDPATASATLNASLGYRPNGVMVDPKFGGIWVSDSAGGSGVLHCYSTPAGSDTPRAVPTAGTSAPTEMTVDGHDHLWFVSAESVAYVKLNGLCATDPGQATYESMVYSGTNPFGVSIAEDTGNGTVWVGDGASANGVIDNVSDYFSPTAYDLPFGGAAGGMGHDGSGNLLVGSSTFLTSQMGHISVVEADSSTFSPNYTLPSGTVASGVAGRGSGASALIAYGDGLTGGIGIFQPSQPTLATLAVAPNSTPSNDHRCGGVAFDGVGQPWALCDDGNRQKLTRLIVTNAWNVLSNFAYFYPPNVTEVGIVGGASSLTFTTSCRGGLTCAFQAGFPRMIVVTATAFGPASITVNGSDGRSVVTDLRVLPNTT